jgi:D-xylose transport system permease protein
MNAKSADNRTPSSPSGGWWQSIRRRAQTVDLGSLPVVFGLIVIWIVFQLANDKYLSPLNITNLLYQVSALGTISVGVVLVLLLAEVDLSVGIVSGLCAAVMAVLNVKNGIPGPAAVLIALGAGLSIGVFQGFWVARFKVPSFIVTLAGLIGWQGLLLFILGPTGTVNLRDPFILGLAGTFFKRDLANGVLYEWVIAAVFILVFGFNQFWTAYRRRREGLDARSPLENALLVAVVAAVALGTVVVVNMDRGMPSAMLFFLATVILFHFVTRSTVFGRHIYAVGGNPEAARRASINVNGIRIAVFGLAGMLAALGGIIAASRLLAVNQSSGGSDLLLNAIASAVIGGTSLFGGRGSAWSALLGALVIQSISNGMDLLALASPIKFMVTGGVLLLAVTIEAVARTRREAAGR